MGNCGFGVAPTRPEHRNLILRTLENVEGMSLESLKEGLGTEWPFESFPEYLSAVESRGSAINVAVMQGHTPLRTYVMGEEAVEREATADEVATMTRLLREAIDAGALGFASSRTFTHMGYDGKPVPSRMASLDEYNALADVLKDSGKGILQVSIGPDLNQDTLAEIARRTGRPITWTALLAGIRGPEGHKADLQRAAELQSEGLEVRPQVSCRPLCFEFNMLEPFPMASFNCFKDTGTLTKASRIALYQTASFRDSLKAQEGFGTAWNQTVVSYFPANPELEECSLLDMAEAQNLHPVDLLLDLAIESDLVARFRMGVANTDEKALTELLQSDAVILGLSDAGAHASQLCDACFSTELLSTWVREKNVLSLEQAIYMLSGQVADFLGLSDRGRLREGYAGDVVILDPATVGCSALKRVYDQPAGQDRLVSESSGIDAVIVNGVLLRKDGRDQLSATDTLPGKVLRSN